MAPTATSPSPLSGAQIIARSLRELGVSVIFGIVGVPIVEIAEAAIDSGIRFIGFRNEQSASYAATAYGYLTGRPGVCLVVSGPGVLHAMAGVGNANSNSFPLLLLAGSVETNVVTKGGFQELDAVSLLTPHTKLAVRVPSVDSLSRTIHNAYRTAWFGRPGTGFVDLPTDIIHGYAKTPEQAESVTVPSAAPVIAADVAKVFKVAQLLKGAKAPLVIVGKGAAYSRAEGPIRNLIDQTLIPFLPSPMGKGVLPDSHRCNASSARSTALKLADVVLVLGAKLNWMFHYGESPKWSHYAKIIQVDISPEEIGRNAGDPDLGLVGDISSVVSQLIPYLSNWSYNHSSSFAKTLTDSKRKNEAKAAWAASVSTDTLTVSRAYAIVKQLLHSISPVEAGGVVYVAEGANTMDVSRSAFPVEHPRLRLDAGTYGTMGVGLGYAIAAHEAYNAAGAQAQSGKSVRKKIVAFEGDSAFGFSAMEVETMARYGMDILIFVMNNGGIYHGDTDTSTEWLGKQMNTIKGDMSGTETQLRSTSLGFEVRYEKLAEACGGKGYFVRTEEELRKATMEGYNAQCPVIINVAIESGRGGMVSGATDFYFSLASDGKTTESKL